MSAECETQSVFHRDSTLECVFIAPVAIPYRNMLGWTYAHEVKEVAASVGWERRRVPTIDAFEPCTKEEALRLVRVFETAKTCTCQRCST